MKRTLLLLLTSCFFVFAQAQPKIKSKKYPSLLWEITGNGLKKPSYLIGTMHVSSKLAFHLPDSFYIALRTAQIVALETNPETWQEDMSNYDFGEDDYAGSNYRYSNYISVPSDFMTVNTLKFYKYDKKIERALYSNPSTINNLLYRSYGNKSSDFEEDTYLDMYIFQCGKKWGKKVTGVENYEESMKLMTEAYRDAAKDRNKKERSYDGDEGYSTDKLQEAYRNGNLDLLDSINQYNSFSAAFDEKFLYRRNEIQAFSMDSIMRSGEVLFAGVGAAHLPGTRGVIEMLRNKGYTLRPVKMGERDSKDKEEIEKARVPVTFHTEVADDGLFKVDIPGKFYKVGDDESLLQKQYADMANGSYYMVSRTMTNAWMWSDKTDEVLKTVDSLLYENVPGKIISKKVIMRNGYKGLDITNRTRRGDIQRYNIFITPFEVIFFKMSGNGDYLKGGDEAEKFFGSIQFKPYRSIAEPASTGWKKYSPPAGGFSIELPHEPYIGNDGSWIFDAEDRAAGMQCRIIRSDIHNYHFIEEDSFDLGLMDESFGASDFIDQQVSRQQTTYKGYPAMDCKYRDKSGSVYRVRFIIQGPHYYTIVAHGKKETPLMNRFLNSFEITPFIYKESKQQKDTSLYFSVNTPVFPENNKIRIGNSRRNPYALQGEEEDLTETDLLEGGAYRNKTISNDTTGEKIYVSFYRSPRYYYTWDSTMLDRENLPIVQDDGGSIVRQRKKSTGPENLKIWESMVSDTGSSRILWTKSFYRDGIGMSLVTESDTLSSPSSFVKKFYDSFTPDEALKGIDPLTKKSNLFFSDFMSNDSILHKRAIQYIDDIDLDSTDLTMLKKAIAMLNWNENKYLETKKSLIRKLGDMPARGSANYLKDLYYALDDTIQLQYSVLESLLQQETSYAFSTFRDIVKEEPPVLVANAADYTGFSSRRIVDQSAGNFHFDNGNFLDELKDSLELTRAILPDLLPLMNLDDYKGVMIRLLALLVDSNQLRTHDYDMYFDKFLLEAKQVLKKQSIAETKKAIDKAEESRKQKNTFSLYGRDGGRDEVNEDLAIYATLLLPWREINPDVYNLLEQLLNSGDKRLKYRIMLLLLRHNKPVHDSILQFFAGLDEYRFQLYDDLKALNKVYKFPAEYNNHLDLGKSSLLDKKVSNKPDSLVYVDRLEAEFKGRKGYIYFYKYKSKKDDLTWKLATAGMIPEDPKLFEYEEAGKNGSISRVRPKNKGYDFTGFTDTKIEEDEGMSKQLKKALKKLLYSHRKSAREFYDNNNDRSGSSFDID